MARPIELWRVKVPGREESRAASKSPHKKFGYFRSISQQAVSAEISLKIYAIFDRESGICI